MNNTWEVDLGGDQQSRARAWAIDQARLRREEKERIERFWGQPAHAWKIPMQTNIPPGVVPFGDLYIIL